MRVRHAKRLHNHDQVRLKKTGEVGLVVGTPALRQVDGKWYVMLHVQFPESGYTECTHLEVE